MIAFTDKIKIGHNLDALANVLDVSLTEERKKFLVSYIAKRFSWEQFRGACRWLSENYERRTFPVPANFHRGAREHSQGRRNIQNNNDYFWRKDLADILGISEERLPPHASMLTDAQRNKLDLVSRGFKIVFNAKTSDIGEIESVSSDQIPIRGKSRGVSWNFS
jgi:hypothetical protein